MTFEGLDDVKVWVEHDSQGEYDQQVKGQVGLEVDELFDEVALYVEVEERNGALKKRHAEDADHHVPHPGTTQVKYHY